MHKCEARDNANEYIKSVKRAETQLSVLYRWYTFEPGDRESTGMKG